MMASERDSRVAVVHGYFPEGGDSILSAFSWEALRHACQLWPTNNIANVSKLCVILIQHQTRTDPEYHNY